MALNLFSKEIWNPIIKPKYLIIFFYTSHLKLSSFFEVNGLDVFKIHMTLDLFQLIFTPKNSAKNIEG